MAGLSTIAFDIETTGFAVDNTLTVGRFDTTVGSRMFLNTDGRRVAGDLEAYVAAWLNPGVTVVLRPDEAGMLAAVTEFVASMLACQEAKLVAYNGDWWNGGFDLPFLRTRLCRHGVA